MSIEKLVTFYEEEEDRQRQLQMFDSVNSCDMVLSENNCIAFTFLNEYLSRKREGEYVSEEKIEKVCIQEDSDKRMRLRFQEREIE